MFTKDDAMQLMSRCSESLHRSGIIDQPVDLKPETVLFGEGSPMDSIGFVTFVTSVEEELNALLGKDVVIAFLDIEDFDESAPALTVDRFSEYLVQVAA